MPSNINIKLDEHGGESYIEDVQFFHELDQFAVRFHTPCPWTLEGEKVLTSTCEDWRDVVELAAGKAERTPGGYIVIFLESQDDFHDARTWAKEVFNRAIATFVGDADRIDFASWTTSEFKRTAMEEYLLAIDRDYSPESTDRY